MKASTRMIKLAAFLSAWVAVSDTSAGLSDMSFGVARVAAVTSIYDADTFRVNIEGWPSVIGYRIPIRVNGIDAPELRGKCPEEKARAKAAKQHTVSVLRGAENIELRNIKRGKYFRLIADVYADNISLADSLIKAGLVRPYDGGTRLGWCGSGQ